MDLIVEGVGTRRLSWSKVGVFICFALSAALLINSLLHPNTLTSGTTEPTSLPLAAKVLHDR